jgi:hypothetical protein
VIRWDDRMFVRQATGAYREGTVWVAYNRDDLMGD